jgi:hypothetical protein
MTLNSSCYTQDMQPEQESNYWQTAPEPQSEVPAQTAPGSEITEQPATGAKLPDQPLTWQASEFVHHEKGGMWFLVLAAVAAVLLVIDIFLIRSWTFGVLIVVMTLAMMVVARRPPRQVNYALSSHGLAIDEKHFSFHDFRAFGVVPEGAFYSIRLVPNKRFMPMVSVYFPTEQGEEIVDIFGSVLPMEHIERDPIDKFVEKIRF